MVTVRSLAAVNSATTARRAVFSEKCSLRDSQQTAQREPCDEKRTSKIDIRANGNELLSGATTG